MDAILVKNLRRVFKSHEGILKRKLKDIVAVEDVSFEIRQGELFGLLGPNRAGRTATVKMLTTLLIPSAGSASILGMDVVREAEQVRPASVLFSAASAEAARCCTTPRCCF